MALTPVGSWTSHRFRRSSLLLVLVGGGPQSCLSSCSNDLEPTAQCPVPPDEPLRRIPILAPNGTVCHLAIHQRNNGATSGSVWSGGLALSEYLQLPLSPLWPWLSGTNAEASTAAPCVLELGSGTGAVGLTAAALGSRVLLTDREVELAQANRDANLALFGERVSVMKLEWGSRQGIRAARDFCGGRVDVILASDVVYPAFDLTGLLCTMQMLASDSTVVLLGYVERDRATTDMLEAALDRHGFRQRERPDNRNNSGHHNNHTTNTNSSNQNSNNHTTTNNSNHKSNNNHHHSNNNSNSSNSNNNNKNNNNNNNNFLCSSDRLPSRNLRSLTPQYALTLRRVRSQHKDPCDPE
ncbi:unnamed protein product [Polarella glacialis]|uniref:Calmodulin-lysine N-methyltransferase n=1 Tax=Polarella glacialis TaxID=89957 RepID=A0A813KWF8_POLGL|nr:unnamed protein product [Polarella glacialis]